MGPDLLSFHKIKKGTGYFFLFYNEKKSLIYQKKVACPLFYCLKFCKSDPAIRLYYLFILYLFILYLSHEHHSFWLPKNRKNYFV
jgi:hypothetical protein